MITLGNLTGFARRFGGGCVGKLRFATETEADDEVRHLVKKGWHRPQLGPLRAYYCDRCDHWHMGHSNRAATRQGEHNATRHGSAGRDVDR